MIRGKPIRIHIITMLTAALSHARKSSPNLDALHRIDAHHGASQVRIQPCIDRRPPPNRHPIITELFSLNEELIRDVIDYELSRDGQGASEEALMSAWRPHVEDLSTWARRHALPLVITEAQVDGFLAALPGVLDAGAKA